LLKRSDNKILDNLSRPLKNSPSDHNQWSWLRHLSLKIILEKVLTQKNIKLLIFYFNCAHVLFVYIVKQKQTKKIADLKKKSWIFKNFQKSKSVRSKFFENSIIYKPSLRSREVPQKIWACSVQPFFLYKQTDRQAKYIYRYYKTNKIITWKKGANYYWSLVNWLKNRKECDLQICKQRNVRSEKEVKVLSFSIHFEISENCNR